MFPIDIATGQFNERMLDQFDAAVADKGFAWKLRDVLPAVYTAGQQAGSLTEEGAKLLDPTGTLPGRHTFLSAGGRCGNRYGGDEQRSTAYG